MIKKLVDDYVAELVKKEKTNGGFPDTDSMRVALFGQVAFKYEQECQEIYKVIKDKIIKDTITEVNDLLDQLEAEESQ